MFIEINNLKKSFGSDSNRVEVLRGVDFSIEKGDICVLLGPSGSGKSTLLNIIGGIDDADAGYISIGGERMADMNEKKLTAYRRKHLGYVFQMYNLIPNLTVRENICLPNNLKYNKHRITEILYMLSFSYYIHLKLKQLPALILIKFRIQIPFRLRYRPQIKFLRERTSK